MQLKITTKSIEDTPKKYVRLIITKDSIGYHCFIKHDDKTIEYRMGVGEWDKITPRTFRTLIRKIIQTATSHKIEYLAIDFSKSPFPKLKKEYDEAWIFSTIVENILLAEYEYTAYKSKEPEYTLKEFLICGGLSKNEKAGFDRGTRIGTYANICRDISNTPGSDMTPTLLTNAAKKAVTGTKASVRVLGKKEAQKLKMGALLAVGKGAKDEPKFIIVEYWGLKKPSISNTEKTSKGKEQRRATDKNDPIVFVGKGITFDTGGLQIKPGMSMYEMHMDMSGGAAVIAAVACAAKLGLKKNIVGLIPAAENAVGENAMRPGDVITSMSGKTIDVLHTDAEGRLVLADALHYAKRYNPKLVIDVATLTGAALVALGQHAHAIMTTDRKLEDVLRNLGEKSGDYVAPLPLWDEYKQYTKGVHGDIANIPSSDSKYGGTITAASFLQHFTEGLRWAHIDMAPRMTSVPSDALSKGATGEPVRLLVNIAENF